MKKIKSIITHSFLLMAFSTSIHTMDDDLSTQKIEEYNEIGQIFKSYLRKDHPYEIAQTITPQTPERTFISLGNNKDLTLELEYDDQCFEFEKKISIQKYNECIRTDAQKVIRIAQLASRHFQFALLENLLGDPNFKCNNERCHEYIKIIGYKQIPTKETLKNIAILCHGVKNHPFFPNITKTIDGYENFYRNNKAYSR